MRRTFVIAKHTFFESIAQPIYPLIMGLGSAVLVIFAMLPFFTLGEDTLMFKDVSFDIILLLALVAALLASSKSVHEEIEDRTMLTLMSKPVYRWEVLVGKYLGLIATSALMILVLGGVVLLSTYGRIPNDYLINANSILPGDIRRLADTRAMHMAGVYPSMLLIWMQVAVLTAISVAISTRVSLVVNLPVVILLYLAGNLTRFVGAAVEERGPIARFLGWCMETVLPFLQVFDLKDLTVRAPVKLAGTIFENEPNGVTLSTIWLNTFASGGYAVLYVVFALCLGMLLFRNRELGGSEG